MYVLCSFPRNENLATSLYREKQCLISEYQELNVAKCTFVCVIVLPLPLSLYFYTWCALIVLILNLDIIVHRMEKRQNCVLMTWLHDEKEKWYFYVLCISYDQKCDFPAVVL